MTSTEIRNAFLEFFKDRGHQIIPSAPMVLKNDPTLMFTNAGMNQFKDYFLGNREPGSARVADTQKCLRVTGKHNDLSEVGHDTFHHTMFEMLGNWSFGDYFKEEAIAWAWEFLTGTMQIEPERLYATVFAGDKKDGTSRDEESRTLWGRHLPPTSILEGTRKDNFWEMGDTGPCGPCSEIHLDLREAGERRKTDGAGLVNKGHPLVIEIWNLVFIQYNRKSDGSLESLPRKHVDTGMGFERLCMAMQDKQSSYDTDLFQPIIREIGRLSGTAYGSDPSTDVAMRVVADHLRAVSFSIADGQLPSNTKAGYVIRRILRRAVRYGFTYLGRNEPFIHELVPALLRTMGDAFPELKAQPDLVSQVIREEEQSFLATLDTGMKLLDQLTEKAGKTKTKVIAGEDAFTLYDTFGFPLDLTELILGEKGMTVDHEAFRREMAAQQNRSKKDAEKASGDWIRLTPGGSEAEFVGYDRLSTEVKIARYRKVEAKKRTLFHLVFNITPFYGESGGQVGDRGILENGSEKIRILDTIKENELIIHITEKLPSDLTATFRATVDEGRRMSTASAHSATHLLHYALREVLGNHVEQKGSLVEPDFLRFDFSHFRKMTGEEIRQVEHRVNRMIRRNTPREEHRAIPMDKAREMGAMALFGEKYGERVRVIRFGETTELCGGTHVDATGRIGSFRILHESSIAAGIRRIEAVTGEAAEKYIDEHLDRLKQIASHFEKQQDPVRAVESLVAQNRTLSIQVDRFRKNKLASTAANLEDQMEKIGDADLLVTMIDAGEPGQLRDLSFLLRSRYPNLCLVLGAEVDGKAHLAIMFSDPIIKTYHLNASQIIREVSEEIQGGGGGQPFFATAGGRKPGGIRKALEAARKRILEEIQ